MPDATAAEFNGLFDVPASIRIERGKNAPLVDILPRRSSTATIVAETPPALRQSPAEPARSDLEENDVPARRLFSSPMRLSSPLDIRSGSAVSSPGASPRTAGVTPRAHDAKRKTLFSSSFFDTADARSVKREKRSSSVAESVTPTKSRQSAKASQSSTSLFNARTFESTDSKALDSAGSKTNQETTPSTAATAAISPSELSPPVMPPLISDIPIDESMLTDEQQRVVRAVLAGHSLFYTGSAGVGKSFVLKVLLQKLFAKYGHDRVAVTASTGAAAVNIGGW